MKPYIYIFIFILLPPGISAQSYQNICSPGVTYYKNRSGYFGAFREDTIHNPHIGDTIFISYTALRDPANSNDCVDISNGSVLGRKIYKKHDGWFFFYNQTNDTVRINTQASVNTAWHFVEQPNYYLEGKVSSIIQDTVLGQPDQVKVITIQAKDYSGQGISHIFNGKQIRLSEHYGLSQVYDIYKIPADTVFYSLEGKASPPLGLQDLDWKQVYDYDTGDVFHYYYWRNTYGTLGWVLTYQKWWIDSVFRKTVYGNEDSVDYEVYRCTRTSTLVGEDLWAYNNYLDTTVLRYRFTNPPADSMDIRKLPNELLDNHYRTSRYLGYYNSKGRPVKYMRNNAYSWSPSCYYACPDVIWEGWQFQFAKGIGMIDEYWDFNQSTWGESSLVYYRKGNETWGTPVATDCSILVGQQPPPSSAEKNILIIPNPFSYKADVIIPGISEGEKVKFILYDEFGRIAWTMNPVAAPYRIYRNNFIAGMYFLIILREDGSVDGKVKVIISDR